MERFAKYSVGLFILLLLISVAWASPSAVWQAPPPSNPEPDTVLPENPRYPIPVRKPGDQPELYDNNKLFLPSSVKEEVTYDPVTRNYTITRKMGNVVIGTPEIYSFEEYSEIDLDRSLRNYWYERRTGASAAQREGILSNLGIGGEAFERIFGSNKVDINPQGSASITFGIRHDRRDDPNITVQRRRNTNFDFQQDIQMNVNAKIGDKIEFTTNYNTEATFDFDKKLKLRYQGNEDEIIQLIEAGDVTFPLNSTLITGSQSLFGLKTQLKFGRALFTGIFSQQKSMPSNITVQGGAQLTEFSVRALDYEENRHFFLSDYFAENYETGVSNLPVINSSVEITNIEVWVTNIGPAIKDNRNIVAFMDIAEPVPFNSLFSSTGNYRVPSNHANNLLSVVDTSIIRNVNNVSEALSSKGLVAGTDYEKVENAKLLSPQEYTLNQRLGFISLNTPLNPDQVLAVAYQYRIIGNDQVFKVGELSHQSAVAPSSLMVKLLKSTSVNTRVPTWGLMMKNVYNIGAMQISPEDFMLNIFYSGNENTVPTGYFTEGGDGVEGIPLLRFFDFDKLDFKLDPPHDGAFDFIDINSHGAGTINSTTGRIYFRDREPFGKFIRSKVSDPQLADKLAFDSLYTMTKSGAQQYPDKNRYIMEGHYKTSSGSEIALNAFNIPQGSVRVSAGGMQLSEGSDYTVDYILGRVTILNEGVLQSGTPINISLENNAMFNMQTQTLMGMHVDYRVNRDLLIGATMLNLNERPLTQKTNFGQEPISNTMWGLDMNYSAESKRLTRWVDMLPFYSSKTPSRIQFNGEFAHFIPGHSRAIGRTGNSYIDDFEGTKSTENLKSHTSWVLASTPQGQTTRDMFPEGAPGTGLSYGFNRAKLAWYIIDPLFYDKNSNLRPKNITDDELSKHSTREVLQNELFPITETDYNQPQTLQVLNLAHYPEERGPYNYNVQPDAYGRGMDAAGNLLYPNTRWSGIMRKIEYPDFEKQNIEYIEFWLMDPFTENTTHRGGELYFNLGDISEDVLRDGRKGYEHGLPTTEVVKDVDTTIWGRVPTIQALVRAFASETGSRQYQDVGFDGLRNADETTFFSEVFLEQIANLHGTQSEAYQRAANDPSADDYRYFRATAMEDDTRYASLLERYKHYNGPDGNSPESNQTGETFLTQNSTLPDVEDINSDNTLSESERYYQYRVNLRPETMNIGENYIADIYEAKNIRLPNKQTGSVKWYLFKIPVQSPDQVIGNIQDYRSIRFMRMFLKNFEEPIVLRFGTLELVRGEWRRYYNSLLSPGDYRPDPNQSQTRFEISTVSIEENSRRQPIPYVMPPGVEREENYNTANFTKMNEQSMVLKVCNLLDGDAKAAYKTADLDFRQFKRLNMYIHAEKSELNEELAPGDVTAFIRFGSDFTENFYEYEIPLEFTPWFTNEINAEMIWPVANEMNLELDKVIQAKLSRDEAMRLPGSIITVNTPYEVADGKNKITVVGMPSLSDVKGIMMGVRNPKKLTLSSNDDGRPKCAEVWFNELRLSEFDKKSGWAATARLTSTLADLGNVIVSGMHSTPGFGSIEKRISERYQDFNTQIDVASNLQLGKFFPEKTGIRIPLHVDYSESRLTPRYNPLNPDIEYKDQIKDLTSNQVDSIDNRIQDITVRKNINLVNMRKDKTSPQAKNRIYDIENFDLTYAYSEVYRRNIDIQYDDRNQHRGGLGYNFINNPEPVRPFQKVKGLDSKYLALIKDFNFYYMPKVLAFRTDMIKDYNERLMRNKSEALILIEPTLIKKWDWNRLYDLKYDLTQSLRFDYQANANAFINEPDGIYRRSDPDYKLKRDSVLNELRNFGTMDRFSQTANATYNLPLQKIPIFNWLNASTRYGSTYRWQASPLSVKPVLGNTIENSNTIDVNAGARLSQLFDKVPFIRNAMSETRQVQRQSRRQQIEQERQRIEAGGTRDTTQRRGGEPLMKTLGNGLIKMVFGLKDVQLTFNQSNGTLLPGFMPEPEVMGNQLNNMAPGWGFVFGSQADIRHRAVNEGWLTRDTLLNQPYLTRFRENIRGKASYEPFPGFRLEINADRSEMLQHQEFFRADGNGNFRSSLPSDMGNYVITILPWRTAFSKIGPENTSETFEKFKENRQIIARRLAAQNPNSHGGGTEGYPDGYGPTSQEVLIPAFLAAYTGTDPSKVRLTAFPRIPMPNWNLNITSLNNIDFLARIFRQINISHGYRSDYGVSRYISNIDYMGMNGFPVSRDDFGNFISEYNMENISLREEFSPLINIDMIWNNDFLSRVELRSSRNLGLSFVNNQLNDYTSKELVVGLGYRFKDVKFNITSPGTGRRQQLSSDLNLKLDLAVRENRTVIRRLDEAINQISSGNRVYTINGSADYMINQRFNARIFLEQTMTQPFLPNQYFNSTTFGGLTLRFTLAQ